MTKFKILLLGLISVSLLLFIMFKVSPWQSSIERDLTIKSITALQQADLSWAKIHFKQRGLDALLSGQAPSEQARIQAENIVSKIRGIYAIDNQITVIEKPILKIKDQINKIKNNSLSTPIQTKAKIKPPIEDQNLESLSNLEEERHQQLRIQIKNCQKRFKIALRHRPIRFNANNRIAQESFPALQQIFTAALSCPDLSKPHLSRKP